MNDTWFVVVNVGAGRRGSPTAAVRSGLESRNVSAEIVETNDLDHLHEVVGNAIGRDIQRFAAVGGDGTAHHLLNAIKRASPSMRPTLAIIPAGSGSDFARTFGQSTKIDDALDRIADPDLYGVDIGRLRGNFGEHYVLNASSTGVVAASAEFAEKLPRWVGGARYTIAFWMALWRFRSAEVGVTIGRHEYSGPALTVVVANGQFFGGGLNIAPRATLVDGDFDVQVIHGPKRVAFAVMPRVIFGAHLSHKAVRRYIGSAATVRIPADWPVEADGEIIGRGAYSIECLPDAIDYVT